MFDSTGHPIRCADVLRHVKRSRSILYKAAWRMHAGLECATDMAMANAHVRDACLWIGRKGHQILGAIGYCEEHPLHRSRTGLGKGTTQWRGGYRQIAPQR